MIVVIGSTYLRGEGGTAAPDGMAGRIAVAAASDHAPVELITKLGDDPAGDALLVAFARAGVGHVAVLRDAVHPTAWRPDPNEPAIETALDPDVDGESPVVPWIVDPADGPALEAADVALALRYLTDYRVLVVVHARPDILAETRAAADWAGAHLVVVTETGAPVPPELPSSALVLEVADDPDDEWALGGRLGRYAAAVDRGTEPAIAYAELTVDVDQA